MNATIVVINIFQVLFMETDKFLICRILCSSALEVEVTGAGFCLGGGGAGGSTTFVTVIMFPICGSAAAWARGCDLPPPRGVFARLWTGSSRAFLLAAGAGAGTCCSCCCCCGGPGRESGATCCRGAVLARGEVAYGGTSRGWYTLGDGWACGGGYAGLRCWDGCGDTGFLAGGATLMNLGCCCSGCCWYCCCC